MRVLSKEQIYISVIPKDLPVVAYAEENLLPQWAIAVIVIGLAGLVFVIIFGVVVLVSRQKRSKKKHPTALTADMLNDLNKNHMGGTENYGQEDFYNVEDTWDSARNDIKPKVSIINKIDTIETTNIHLIF